MFVGGRAPSSEELLAAIDDYEQVLPSARAHHYSQLGYALLGEVVARASSLPYARLVEERILCPLGLERTSWRLRPRFAQGHFVEECAGIVAREPHVELSGGAPSGQLWSTVGDLCRLASFLAGDSAGILERVSLDQMWTPPSMIGPDAWSASGSASSSAPGTGGSPAPRRCDAGFLAGLHIHRGSGVGAAVLTNASTRLATRELCLELASATIERWRPRSRPGGPSVSRPPRRAQSSAAGGRRAANSSSPA